ncbi:DUF418 domain-containing protein [Pseudalkalibacillus hwajinpoensis]|uniref:DUF418 domain-containing protein n=1 Tax=Guptibacillus hwajinpoensis TaxID=208199 RepID=UPI00325BDE24
MVDFHSPWMYVDQLGYWGNQWNQLLMNVIDIFAQASFYPLFSFLFGYGFVILRKRIIDKGASLLPIMLKRMLFLFLLGVLHFTFIWHGDILFTYSLSGLLLLVFIRLEGHSLINIGLVIWLFYAIILFLIMLPFSSTDFTSHNPTAIQQSISIYGSGSYLDIMSQRLSDWYYVNGGINGVFLLFSIFPYFLFGAGFAKKGWFNGAPDSLLIVKKLMVIGGFGFAVKLSPFLFDSFAFTHLQDSLGGPLVSLFYMATISLVYHSGKRVKPFEWMGKMALTNYLLQSLIGTLIFYSYGLGQYGTIEVSTGVGLVIAIFLLQIVFSRIWLQYFRYGLVEWIWRLVTYQKRFSIKRNNAKGDPTYENH